MKNSACILYFSFYVIIAFSQNDELNIYKNELAKSEVQIESLKSDNKNLRKEVSQLFNQRNTNYNRVQELLDQLVVNTVTLQEKENHISLLYNQIRQIDKSNSDFIKKLSTLKEGLTEVNDINRRYEEDLVEILKERENLELLKKAKRRAIQTVIFKRHDKVFFDLFDAEGEQVEPRTQLSFYVRRMSPSHYVELVIHNEYELKPFSVRLNGQGSHAIFEQNNMRYKLILDHVYTMKKPKLFFNDRGGELSLRNFGLKIREVQVTKIKILSFPKVTATEKDRASGVDDIRKSELKLLKEEVSLLKNQNDELTQKLKSAASEISALESELTKVRRTPIHNPVPLPPDTQQSYVIRFFTSSYSNKTFPKIQKLGKIKKVPTSQGLTIYHLEVSDPGVLSLVHAAGYRDAKLVN